MLEIRTDIEIAAEPARVWEVLMDFAAHPQWNPFVRSIEGTGRVGDKLAIHVQPQGGKGMRFRPVVLANTPRQEFRWRGRLLMPGLFDGEHYFQLQPLAPGRTRFVHGEKFSGLLVGMAKASLEGGTRSGFVAMNEAIKQRAETPAQ